MAGLSMLSRLAVVIGMIAVLSPCAMAQSASGPGRGHSKMSFSPVKAKFGGKTSSMSNGIRIGSGVRGAPVVNKGGLSVRSFATSNAGFVRDVRFKPIGITKQTSTTKSNFAKSRASFVKKPTAPKFVRTAPMK